MRKHPIGLFLIIAMPLLGLARAQAVNDSRQAISVAVTAWGKLASRDLIGKSGPYSGLYRNGVWFVTASRKLAPGQSAPEAEIRASDGQVLRASFPR